MLYVEWRVVGWSRAGVRHGAAPLNFLTDCK